MDRNQKSSARDPPQPPSLMVGGTGSLLSSNKISGLSSGLSGDVHIEKLAKKASKQLQYLTVTARHGPPAEGLVTVYTTLIHPQDLTWNMDQWWWTLMRTVLLILYEAGRLQLSGSIKLSEFEIPDSAKLQLYCTTVFVFSCTSCCLQLYFLFVFSCTSCCTSCLWWRPVIRVVMLLHVQQRTDCPQVSSDDDDVLFVLHRADLTSSVVHRLVMWL